MLLSSFRQEQYSDMAQYHAASNGFEGSAVQLEPGVLRLSVSELQIGDLLLRSFATNRSLHWRTQLGSNLNGIWLSGPAQGAQCRWQGRERPQDALSLVTPQREQSIVTPTNWCDADITVSDRTLADIPVANPIGAASAWRGADTIRIDSAAASRVRAEVLGLLHNESLLRDLPSNPGLAESIRDNLLSMMASGIESAQAQDGVTGSALGSSYRRIVSRAERALLSSVVQRWSVEALAAEVGVTIRTLQRAFQFVYGVTPSQYLLRQRLSKARSELVTGGRQVHVGDLATRYQFASASEFARHFRRHFGQSPSQARALV